MEKLLQKEAGTYERFRLKYLPNRRDLERQRKERFAYEPEFAVVVPLYRTPLPYLEDLIRIRVDDFRLRETVQRFHTFIQRVRRQHIVVIREHNVLFLHLP